MALRLITADERLSEDKVTAVVFGRAKIGKTSLLMTMPADTLFLNLESGMKSVQGWRGDHVDVQTFLDAADIACLIGGVDLAAGPDDFYSQGHYDKVVSDYGAAINLARFKSVFVDSITDLTRLAMTWAKTQPAAFSEKSGKPDMRGAYGLLGREVVRMLRHIQHAKGKNVIFVGGLERKIDEFNRETFEPQAEGGKTGAELPFIVDQIITMSDFDYDDTNGWSHNFGKGKVRAFCCLSPNAWGLPGGDRSGNLGIIEEPHLGRLIEKINSPRKPGARLHYDIPHEAAPATETVVS
jgi:hypothetical protein